MADSSVTLYEQTGVQPVSSGEMYRVDGNGDTAFAMSDGTKIQVNGSLMAIISEPLKTMLFSPIFQEGQKRLTHQTNQPVEVSLPDDDSRAMLLLCELAHHKHTPGDFDEQQREDWLNVAVIAQKYLMTASFKHSVAAVIALFLPLGVIGVSELLVWLDVAYLLDSQVLFMKVSEQIVWLWPLSSSLQRARKVLAKDEKQAPAYVYGVLERHILTTRIQIFAKISDTMRSLATVESEYDVPRDLCASTAVDKAINQWDARGHSIFTLLSSALPHKNQENKHGIRSLPANQSTAEAIEMFTALVDEWNGKVLGLCLECARDDGESTVAKDCTSHKNKTVVDSQARDMEPPPPSGPTPKSSGKHQLQNGHELSMVDDYDSDSP